MGWNRSYHQRLFHDDFLKVDYAKVDILCLLFLM